MNNAGRTPEAGFSLLEILITTAILLVVGGIVLSAIVRMTAAQQTIWNRTEMHSGVRSATELLQQEIGQAGRASLPSPGYATLAANVTSTDSTATLNSTSGIFNNELLVVEANGDESSAQETVQVTNVNSSTQITVNQITSNGITAPRFHYTHATGAIIRPAGGFATGVVPPDSSVSGGTYPNGSTGYKLKLYGDINGDGNMVYVEYRCDTTTNFALYRTMVNWNALPATKPNPPTADLILLSNITSNPAATSGGSALPCFQYQMDGTNSYVLDVSVTLTAYSQTVDPITKKSQKETKALLNISPRNVISTWMAAGGNADRIQPMPLTITALLP
jgi:type II secretory pathway pseudopilin PulG